MIDLSSPFGYGGGSGTSYVNNLAATTAPTVNDDSGDGYTPLSLWVNTTASPAAEIYMCTDATVGAAVWVKTSLTIDELGTMALQNSNNVSITGGNISGITDLSTADGGTGASTPAGARTNLGAAAVYDSISSYTASGGTNALNADTDKLNIVTGTTTHAFNLPSAPATGHNIKVKNMSTGVLTINRAGSDTIEGATSFAMNSGDDFVFVYTGSNLWIVRG